MTDNKIVNNEGTLLVFQVHLGSIDLNSKLKTKSATISLDDLDL